jgi:protein TonB
MSSRLSLLSSALLHGGIAGLLAWAGREGPSREAAVGVAVPPFVALSLEAGEPEPTPEFRAVEEMPRAALEPAEPVLEFDREPAPLPEVDGAPFRPAAPAPSWSRPRVEALRRVVRSAESVPEVETVRVAVEVHNPPPEYPLEARRARKEGVVVVDIAIRADGTCGDVRVVEDASDPAFRESVLAAVRTWKFQPALRGGRPVESVQRFRFVFRIGN